MKIPIPPTGGQGGHYGFGSTKATRIFDTGKAKATRERVPRRFRRLRLRRRRRSRVGHEHPGMTLLVFAVLAVTLGLIVITVVGRVLG